jgi:4-hydroxy-3-methylbut-2-enyl diphosphate reductase
MEVLVAKNCGFCRGVKKAVDAAMTIETENTYVYGEIIHNPEVVKAIENRGIVMVEDIDQVPNGATLIIRSHGIGKEVYRRCSARDIKLVDCTCEFVKRTQRIVEEKYREGKTIVILGEATHPEVIGLQGCCEGNAYIFSSEEENFSLLEGKECCIVAQTTFSKEKFEKIIKNLENSRLKTVEVFETICYTTIERQNEANELSKQCEAILVIGGLNSSNTNKLYDICAKNCSNVFRLEQQHKLWLHNSSICRLLSWSSICSSCWRFG